MSFLGRARDLWTLSLPRPLGLADMDIVGGAVTGAGESIGLDKGLDHQRAVSVASLPVVRQPPTDAREHAGGGVLDLHPGQDQEAGVVDHQMQTGMALLWVPADEPITRRHLPGAGSEPEHDQHLGLDVATGSQERARRVVVEEEIGSLVVFNLTNYVLDTAYAPAYVCAGECRMHATAITSLK